MKVYVTFVVLYVSWLFASVLLRLVGVDVLLVRLPLHTIPALVLCCIHYVALQLYLRNVSTINVLDA